MPETRISRRQRRKEARPAEIVSAALMLFHTKGYAATKIDDVARAAGVTKGTVYLYFSSKEELFKAAIRETVLPNLERIKAVALGESTARARLRTSLRLWAMRLNTCRGSISKLMIAEAGNFPELAEFYREEISDRMRQMVIDIVEYGIAQGEFSPCNPDNVTRALCAPILLSNIWRHTFLETAEQQPELTDLADSLIDIVINGIAAKTKETDERQQNASS